MSGTVGIDSRLRERLVCPRDHGPLSDANGALRCAAGHVYPIVDGVPVMLIADVPQTFKAAGASLAGHRATPLISGRPICIWNRSKSATRKSTAFSRWRLDSR